MKKFYISIGGEVALSVDEIWPDGDAPENPTVYDVHEALEKSGTLGDTLSEWNMERSFSFQVTE